MAGHRPLHSRQLEVVAMKSARRTWRCVWWCCLLLLLLSPSQYAARLIPFPGQAHHDLPQLQPAFAGAAKLQGTVRSQYDMLCYVLKMNFIVCMLLHLVTGCRKARELLHVVSRELASAKPPVRNVAHTDYICADSC